MIRINLLQVERAPSGPSALEGLAANRIHLIGATIVLAALAGIGWWYMAMQAELAATATAIQQAQAERQRLTTVLAQIKQFEDQRTQLQQRVALIEQLRKGQHSPVTLLDQVSRSLPERLWLTELKQVGADVTIDGRTTTLTSLSDFIGNLEGSGAFTRPVEILNSEVEKANDTDIVRFQVKATFPLGDMQADAGKAAQPGAAAGKARTRS